MKKKLLSIILIGMMSILFVSCGSSETKNTGNIGSNQDTKVEDSKKEEQGKEELDKEDGQEASKPKEDEPDQEEKDPEGSQENSDVDDTQEPAQFEEIVVVDNEECSIKITGLNQDSIWGYGLKVNLENKSSEKSYMFALNSAAVNGVQCEPLFATTVAAGKKSNDEISLPDSDLKENGVTEFTDIELSFHVYDSEDFMAEDVAVETVHVYPFGEDKAVAFERAVKDSDTVIVDDDNVTVIVTGYREDEIWGYTADVYLVNKTENEVMFSVEDVSVNGYMVDPFWASSVIPGKCRFGSISWSDSSLEENSIETVEEIEMVLRAYNSNDFLADDYVNEKVVLKP